MKIEEVFNLLQKKCEFLRKNVQKRTKSVSIFDYKGQILAQTYRVVRALPMFDNSAMDGYAIRLADLGKSVDVLGVTLAGATSNSVSLRDGFAQKVMTGSPTPLGAQAVAPIEMVKSLDKKIMLPEHLRENQHIRKKGEELELNTIIASKFTRLKPHTLGILASQGIDKIRILKGLKIAIFSSGDEVIEPWQKAKESQIYNSNAITIFQILKSYRHKARYLGILPDDKSKLKKALKNLPYDVVITSGGASVGDADFFKSALKDLGAEILFDGVDTKPGRHLAVARLDSVIFILLPGNPLASTLHLHTIILSFLEYLSGAQNYFLKSQMGILQNDLKLRNGAQNIALFNFENLDSEIRLNAFKGGSFGSSALAYVWQNSAFGVFEGDCQNAKKGDKIKFISFGSGFEKELNFINK